MSHGYLQEKNNTVAALQRELESCEKEKINKQSQAEELLSHASEEALYFGQLILSIRNLFERCVEKRPNIQHANHLIKSLLQCQTYDLRKASDDQCRCLWRGVPCS